MCSLLDFLHLKREWWGNLLTSLNEQDFRTRFHYLSKNLGIWEHTHTCMTIIRDFYRNKKKNWSSKKSNFRPINGWMGVSPPKIAQVEMHKNHNCHCHKIKKTMNTITPRQIISILVTRKWTNTRLICKLKHQAASEVYWIQCQEVFVNFDLSPCFERKLIFALMQV